MRNFFGLAIFGFAMLAAIPASASTTTFNFTNCGTSTGGTNGSCSSDLSAYAVTPSGQSGTAITATATAYYTTNTTNADFNNTGAVGAYSGAGLGICELPTQSNTGQNCADPYHQIDNGSNPGSGQDYEFLLIQFSAAVNLSQITLGNFGVPSGDTSDPFIATFYTTSSSALTNALTTTSIGSITGTDGFSAAGQTTCTSNCADNDTGTNETLVATDVTYLLIGASINNAGQDYFKLQDITASAYTTGQSPTPEPATFALFGLALTGLGVYGRKRKSSRN
jgi:hypothetical protein